MKELNIELFEKAEVYILSLPEKDRAKVFANIKSMARDQSSVEIKLLKHPIKELKIKKHRLLFFVDKQTIYIVSGFAKKTQKTPLQEIRNAEEIAKNIKQK